MFFLLPKADGVFKTVKAGMLGGEKDHPDLRIPKLLRHQDQNCLGWDQQKLERSSL